MKTLICAAALVAVVCLFSPQPSYSFTISVGCNHNPVPPPDQPYENVLCHYSWAPGGQLFNVGGKADGFLQYWPSGGTPVFTDNFSTGIFTLSGQTPPVSAWIKCTSVSGTWRVYMDGFLYRYVIQMNGPGFWSQQDHQSDAEFASVFAPLVLC
jgi:hypothetical protein